MTSLSLLHLSEDVLLEVFSFLKFSELLPLHYVSSTFNRLVSHDYIYEGLCELRWAQFSEFANVTLPDLLCRVADTGFRWKSLYRLISYFRIHEDFRDCSMCVGAQGCDSHWAVSRPAYRKDTEKDDPVVAQHGDECLFPLESRDSDGLLVQYLVDAYNNYYTPAPVFTKNHFVTNCSVPSSLQFDARNGNKHGFVVRMATDNLRDQHFGIIGSLMDQPIPDFGNDKTLIFKTQGNDPVRADYQPNCRYWGLNLVTGRKVREKHVNFLFVDDEDPETEYVGDRSSPPFWREYDELILVAGCVLDLEAKTISFFVQGKDLGVAFRNVELPDDKKQAFAPVFFLYGEDYYELLCCY